jgi:hypothetical protein
MISRYPDMPAEEADGYISKIENEENVPICHAILGRVEPNALENDAQLTCSEFQRWAEDRTERTRNEQWNSRRRRKETSLAIQLNRLHQQGRVSDEMLLLYGISGELPDRSRYMTMSLEEKQAMWRERMESRYGPNWEQRFPRNMPRRPVDFEARETVSPARIEWGVEGF